MRRLIDWALLALLVYGLYIMHKIDRSLDDSERQYKRTMDTISKIGESNEP